MADKQSRKKRNYIKIANVFSVAIIILLSAIFIVESLISDINAEFYVSGIIILASLVIVISVTSKMANSRRLAFNVPMILLLFYTLLMATDGWRHSYFLLATLVFCIISCFYSNITRSVIFVIVQNIFIGLLLLIDVPINGHGVPLYITLINWGICIFSSIAILLLTRSATVHLDKALEHQTSFKDLLSSTENYIAMVNEKNEVIYASKTLSMLANTENHELVQGRPFIDLFPGRTLKMYAGRMLDKKGSYSEDWEFSLEGEKRYFRAISSDLTGLPGGSLISLYDMTHTAERDEIAAMKDAMEIGLFFMNKEYVIQDHYSRYLEKILLEDELAGKFFTDIIANSVSESELESIKDYFKMVFNQAFDPDMLREINPLDEFNYYHPKSKTRKILHCVFSTMDRGDDAFLLVTIYDITARVKLQEKLAEEEARRQEEMQSLFELVRLDPAAFNDFLNDMEQEFESIEKVLKNPNLSAHEVAVKVYQSVHAIKSNAVILGLEVFGHKAHLLESNIKLLCETEGEIPFVEMLNLAMEVEKLSLERERFKEIIEQLQSYGNEGSKDSKKVVKALEESFVKTAGKAAQDLEKQVRLETSIDSAAFDASPKRVIKEIVMQLIRNSVVHGIELPEERITKGKDETGTIKLSIKMSDDNRHIHVKLSDDGNGLDYKKISERALKKNLIKEEDAGNKEMLNKIIFSAGFSTSETEGFHGGRGIGLNLVRDRVKDVNGKINLRSEPNKGTLFSISIPVT